MNRRVVFSILYLLHHSAYRFFHDPNGFVVGRIIVVTESYFPGVPAGTQPGLRRTLPVRAFIPCRNTTPTC
jgi:hypothetical protein